MILPVTEMCHHCYIELWITPVLILTEQLMKCTL